MTLTNPSLERMRDELHVNEEFLARYNRPGPRYTSYPTAPVWNDAFGPSDLEEVHAEAERAQTPLSLYMHLPFCESLCLFCACNVIIQKDKRVAILTRSRSNAKSNTWPAASPASAPSCSSIGAAARPLI